MLVVVMMAGIHVTNVIVQVMEEILVAVNIVEEQVPEIENSKIFYLDWNNKNKTVMGY